MAARREKMGNRWGSEQGFTLLEVLVALVVAALLASGLLAVQQHGMNQARDGDERWDHVNLVQEALLGQDMVRMREDTGWRWPAQHGDRQWRVHPLPAGEDRPGAWMTMVTRTPEQTMEWAWPEARP